jgi:hypothetical protein
MLLKLGEGLMRRRVRQGGWRMMGAQVVVGRKVRLLVGGVRAPGLLLLLRRLCRLRHKEPTT